MNSTGSTMTTLGFGEHGLRILLLGCVYAYRWVLSPLKTTLLGDAARCRFTPSCSQYALTALQRLANRFR